MKLVGILRAVVPESVFMQVMSWHFQLGININSLGLMLKTCLTDDAFWVKQEASSVSSKPFLAIWLLHFSYTDWTYFFVSRGKKVSLSLILIKMCTLKVSRVHQSPLNITIISLDQSDLLFKRPFYPCCFFFFFSWQCNCEKKVYLRR